MKTFNPKPCLTSAVVCINVLLAQTSGFSQNASSRAPRSYQAFLPDVAGFQISSVIDVTENGLILVQATELATELSQPLLLSVEAGQWTGSRVCCRGPATSGGNFHHTAQKINSSGWVGGKFSDPSTGEHAAFIANPGSQQFRIVATSNDTGVLSVDIAALSDDGHVAAVVDIGGTKTYVRSRVDNNTDWFGSIS